MVRDVTQVIITPFQVSNFQSLNSLRTSIVSIWLADLRQARLKRGGGHSWLDDLSADRRIKHSQALHLRAEPRQIWLQTLKRLLRTCELQANISLQR
jgi:hypothetical protein